MSSESQANVASNAEAPGKEVNSEAILPNDVVTDSTTNSLTNSVDLSNSNNNINNNNNTNNNSTNDNSSRTHTTSNNNNNNNNDSGNSSSSIKNNNDNGNSSNIRTMPEVVVNGPDNKKADDFDIDEEVMGFMHAYIHSSGKDDGVDNSTSGEGEDGDGQKGTSWSQFTRVILAKKVAEAFVANKPDEGAADEPSTSSGARRDNMPSWDAPLLSARDSATAPCDSK